MEIFVLQAGDKIHVTASHTELAAFFKTLGIYKQRARNVMIIGGGKIAHYLALQLLDAGMQVKIIELDRQRCYALSEWLPKATIIHGDGTDQELLLQEGIEQTDAVVSLTGMDEENILISMYAQSLQRDKVVTKINRLAFLDMLGNMGLDTIVSPKTIAANRIIRYVRAMHNSDGSSVQTLYKLVGGQVEALEFIVSENAKFAGIPLKDLKTKPNILLACIIRGNKLIIPRGNDTMEPRDSVIVVTNNQYLRDLSDILESERGVPALMNGRMIVYVLGRVMLICGVLMLLPLLVVFLHQEKTALSFIIPIILLVGGGFGISFRRPSNRRIYTREGFFIVAMSWVILSAFGALPFWISGEIPNYLDAFFETVSGFTTTGASILSNVESLSQGMLFWRSFTHWVGGMGVLVFVMAVLPRSEAESQSMYILRTESPGPQVGKLVSKMRLTARILYGIYLGLTLLEFILLAIGGMPLFDSLLAAFSTAGTGGFGIKVESIAFYDSVYIDMVISVFMVLFGINFNVFFLLLAGDVFQAFRCQEVRWYLGIVGAATLLIAADVYHLYGTVGQSLRYAFFQVSSIITTTGFATADFTQWPMFSQVILVCLMFCGACAGSTGGGIKVSRILILGKIAKKEIEHMISPRSVNSIKFEGKTVEQEVFSGVSAFLIVYMIVYAVSFLLLSLDQVDFSTAFTAVAACINNVGPGLGAVGPAGHFGDLSWLSKVVLCFDMLAGRLELFPMLMLFSPLAWKR